MSRSFVLLLRKSVPQNHNSKTAAELGVSNLKRELYMPGSTAIEQYDFPWPNGDKGYSVFPNELENDSLVAFHGTAETNLDSIVQNGFVIQGTLPSISFARNSSIALNYACEKRNSLCPNGIVIAVRFESLDDRCVAVEPHLIYLYCQDKQPKIIGYCLVPGNYVHA